MNVVPARRWLVRHTFLDVMHALPRRWKWPGVGDILAARVVIREAFVSDALALRDAVRAGMAEAAMEHVPAMQTRASRQRRIPGIGIKALSRAIAVDHLK